MSRWTAATTLTTTRLFSIHLAQGKQTVTVVIAAVQHSQHLQLLRKRQG
jgi:hypothetical protein